MIQMVYEQCLKSKYLSAVIIATDNKQIYDAVKAFGGNVLMTSDKHLNGTSRCAEVITQLSAKYDFVINIQGDEPLIHPTQIDKLCNLFIHHPSVKIGTLVKKETDLSLAKNKNVVKAIVDENNFAVDFLRELPIIANPFFFKHIGIYGFQSDVLQKIVNLPQSKHEIERHLEQMRWLDNGFHIKVELTEEESISVDTPEDLEKITRLLKKSE